MMRSFNAQCPREGLKRLSFCEGRAKDKSAKPDGAANQFFGLKKRSAEPARPKTKKSRAKTRDSNNNPQQ